MQTIEEKFSDMWKQARYDAGISQDELARRMKRSKRTIQNWEAGYSCPSQLEGFQLFRALGLEPLPYYLRLFYGEDHLDPSGDVEEKIFAYIKSLTKAQKEKIWFCMEGMAGSGAAGLEMLVAHYHTLLVMREMIASTILQNYSITIALDGDPNKEQVHPDIDLLKRAIDKAIDSSIQGMNAYTLTNNTEKE